MLSIEKRNSSLQLLDEGIHLLLCVVDVEARPSAGIDAQVAVQGLGAVVARANRHARKVEHRRDISRMEPFHVEGDKSRPESSAKMSRQG